MDPLSLTQSKEDDTDLRCPCYCEENVWRLLERRRQLHQRCNSCSASSSSASSVLSSSNRTRRPEQHYYVVFISNENQTVAMLHQKAASSTSEEGLIVWDYHVILLCHAEHQQSLSDDKEQDDDAATSSTNDNYDPTKESSTSKNRSRKMGMMMLVYDLDTTLEPYPLPLADYLDRSFPSRTGSTTTARSRTTMMMRKQPLWYRPKFRIVPADEFRHYFASDRSHMWNAATGQYNAPPPPYECITTAGSSSSSHRTTTIIGADAADTADAKNHQHGSPALQTNTLPYYLNFQDIHQRQCPLPKEALGVILSLEEFYQVDRWRSSLA
jgi:N-terminal glutamine amidase